MDKEQIIRESKKIFNEFSDACLQVPGEKFFFQPREKWSIAENVDHVRRSIKMTKLAYSLPKLFTRAAFGRANRPSKTFPELFEKYKARLQQGGKASGRYIPKISTGNQFQLVKQWQKENEKYLEALDLKWKDAQLDYYIAPHPLLGKLTLRELCYFTIFHTGHHLTSIKERLAEQSSNGK